MILQGVLDRSLGNFVCLRGYARLGDLYQISAPDPSYQRDLISHQQERMEKFLDDGDLLLADITLGNKNVYHEIGYLMGLNEGKNNPKIILFFYIIKKLQGKTLMQIVQTYQVLFAKDTNDLRTKIMMLTSVF